jgi:hypothetical protein
MLGYKSLLTTTRSCGLYHRSSRLCIGSSLRLNRKLSKAEAEAKVATTSSVNLEDKDGLRKAVLEHLFTESERGNAQASDKLAKLAGLGEEKQDIIIEVVNYNDVMSKRHRPHPKRRAGNQNRLQTNN